MTDQTASPTADYQPTIGQAFAPGVRCPMALGPNTVEIQNTISFEPLPEAETAKAA